ncbi:zinc-finger domain-containing protein [Mycoavidus sp. B2-EB]|uniref:zinc-finger domain-containing protein n=1 Tax=Mycoavidus sp. B2-EB TaxID=2651972 RepID=UPI001627C800|nr:zinc-finger domain-containing protein [Mycoavidus sp. B2-EB]BBO60218.1 zinc-finger domain-containing protein [Mycoavidus sp. B2-EB]
MMQTPLLKVNPAALPVFCPNPQMPLWSSHPRVFIDVSHGAASCPYCGACYALDNHETATGDTTSV